ncbi:STAS domain-containing protein [Novipirellula herctigrandis]
MSPLNPLEVRIDQGEATVAVSEHELNDAKTASQLSANLSELIEAHQHSPCGESQSHTPDCLTHNSQDNRNTFNLDLGNVGWVSSVGLNELIELNRNARNKGVQLVLTNVQSVVREVFLLTRLERIFEISWDEAQTLA